MEEPSSTESLWEGIFAGGPIVTALHLCMIVSFCVAVFFALRRAGSVTAFAWSVAPFIFGALAMWVGILGFVAIFPSFFSGLYEGDPASGLHSLQRPFFIGIGLSSLAVAIYFLTRTSNFKIRNAPDHSS